MARKDGYSVGFVTLTYRKYPTLPKKCFCDPSDFRRVPCFSRSHIKSLIHHLQDKIYDSSARGSSIQYCVCSELGKATKRPHYHMCVTVPPGVSPETFFGWIRKYWYRKHGMVFPSTYLGPAGHNGFLVDNCSRGVAAYCAKYCCKDMDFEWSVDDLLLNKKCKAYKYARPFHSQSRSLGGQFIDGLSDCDKLKLLFDGYSFIGDDRLSSLPLYLKNKILFNPRYIKHEKTAKRLVRRVPTPFFNRNFREIFKRKSRYYETLLNNCGQSTWLVAHGVSPDAALEYSRTVNELRSVCASSAQSLANDYLAYFGIPREYSYDADRAAVWFNRYLESPRNYGSLIDQSYFANVSRLFAYTFSVAKFSDIVPSIDPELTELVSDYHNNLKD